jgi:hypothetical protein
MPRPRKTDKFFIYFIGKEKRKIGVNRRHSGAATNLTFKDFTDFLEKNGLETSKVIMPPWFKTIAKI